MNRRTLVPSEQISQHHYSGTEPIQPFSYANQPPAPPRKSIQHDTEAITQTRSFRMLQGWISDSEKGTSTSVTSPDQPTATPPTTDQQSYSNRRFSAGVPTTNPSRSFRYLEQQYAADHSTTSDADSLAFRRRSDIPTPYRPMKSEAAEQTPINRSDSVNNREDLAEIYTKLPPSFRAREPEARRFSGSSNPSRAFRFLQKMTEEDQQKDPTPVAGYVKPHERLKTNGPPTETGANADGNGF